MILTAIPSVDCNDLTHSYQLVSYSRNDWINESMRYHQSSQ
uniref:Uncharacterized protein n=1 Tax=viral metagenome TaxID=1070528 RepID=A0A6C0BLN7_9ZZZZ